MHWYIVEKKTCWEKEPVEKWKCFIFPSTISIVMATILLFFSNYFFFFTEYYHLKNRDNKTNGRSKP